MGERREGNPNKRMLFTEFGPPGRRPDVPPAVGAANDLFLAANLPSLEELALSLDLDFEDDQDSPSSTPSRPAVMPEQFDDDDAPATGASRPPTLSAEEDDPEETWHFDFSPFAGGLYGDGEDDRDGRDEPNRPDSPADDAGETDRPFQAFPDDAGMEEMDDILSAVPPPAATDRPEPWRGQRLGVEPPRPIPYGGITRLDEWYRPPEREENAGEHTEADKNRLSASAIFSDLDLESIWNERTASAGGRRASESGVDDDNAAGTRVSMSRPGRDEVTLIMPAEHDEPRRSATTAKRDRDEQAKDARRADETDRLDSDAERGRRQQPKKREAKRETPKPYRRPAAAIEVDGNGFLDDEPPDADTPDAPENTDRAAGDTGETPPPSTARENDQLGDLDLESLMSSADDDASPGSAVAAPVVGDDAIVAIDHGEGEAADDADGEGRDDIPGHEAWQEGDDEYLPEADQDAETADTPDDEEEEEDETAAYLAELDAVASEQHASHIAAPKIGDRDLDPIEQGQTNGDDDPDPLDEFASLLSDNAEDTVFGSAAGAGASPSAFSSDLDDADGTGGDGGGASAPLDSDEPGEAAEEAEEAVALNPEDVFSSFDDMDFEDDGLDDEMKAMLDDGDEPEAEAGDGAETSAIGEEALPAAPPADLAGKAAYYAKKIVFRIIPAGFVKKLGAMLAWRENWWFYFDLLAAIIASASLAIIISYFIWYRK